MRCDLKKKTAIVKRIGEEIEMDNIISIDEYKKRKKDEVLSQYAFLRPFDFANLRYNEKIKKNGVTFTFFAYRSPYDGRNLIFDVYNKDCELIKIFMVTEEEHCVVSNLDYHIWNKVDGDSVGNPVDKSRCYFEPEKGGEVDPRDLLPPWNKENKGRFDVADRESYDLYIQYASNLIRAANDGLEDAYKRTMRKKHKK